MGESICLFVEAPVGWFVLALSLLVGAFLSPLGWSVAAGTDPSGLLATARGLTVSVGIGAGIQGASIGASVAIIKTAYDLIPKMDPLLRRVLKRLKTDVKTKRDIETERDQNRNYLYFFHGSSSSLWAFGQGGIDPTAAGNSRFDFGLGFYTFAATPEGFLRSSQQATLATQRDGGAGAGFLLVVRILRAKWNRLTKKNYGTRFLQAKTYLPDVNAFRSGTRSPLTNKDVAFGAVAKRGTIGPWTWVANPSYPEQYKFESIVGVSNLETVGVIPLTTTMLA